MKKMTKFAALLMALVLAMGSMTACGGNDGSGSATTAPQATAAGGEEGGENQSTGEATPVTLKVWTPQEEQKQKGGFGDYGDNLLNYMVEEFNKSQSNWVLTIDAAVCSEADLNSEMSKDAEAGADVFMLPGDQALGLQESGVLYPLSGDGAEVVKANNPEAAIEAITFTDKDLGQDFIYGVPFTSNQWFIYYDKSLFTEDDVKSLDTMMAKDLGDGVYNFSMPMTDSFYTGSFFFAAGCELFTNGDNSVCTFNDASGLEAANYMIDMVSNKKFINEDGKGSARTKFKEGKLGAWCGGSWSAEDVKKELGDNYAAAALPTIKLGDKEVNLQAFADYKYIGVNSHSEQKEAAQAFAEFLGGEAMQKVRFEARGVIPTWSSLASDEAVQSDPVAVAIDNQKDHLAPRAKTKQMNNYWNPVKAFGQGVYNKEITKDNAQAKLDEMVNNILAEITE